MSAVAVVAGIIEDLEGRVLLAERPPGKRLAGLWEFPGGKVDAGEHPDQALARELKEELELDVRIVKTLGVFPHVYDWGAIDLHVFVVRALGEPRTTKDVHAFKWISPSEIAGHELAPADLDPLRAYLTSRP